MWWNDYVGIPFMEKGRSPESSGLDCWGLVHAVYHDILGIELPSYLEYYESTKERELLGKVIGAESKEKWEDVDVPKEFDVIILRVCGVPMHVGLVTKPGYMLHCAKGVGTVHEKYQSLKWRTNVMGFARHGKLSGIRSAPAVQS